MGAQIIDGTAIAAELRAKIAGEVHRLGVEHALVPWTPQGCILLTKTVWPSLAGGEAVVVGRSNTVGKPRARLLLAENATVTVAHSHTGQIPAVCRRADLLYVAVGRAELVRGDW